MAAPMSNLLRLFYMTWCFSMVFFYSETWASQVEVFDLLMPGVQPKKPESYLCTPIRIDSQNDYYIVGFVPNATMETAHHMLLFGCDQPGADDAVWNCGGMAQREDGYQSAGPCRGSSQIIYAWAHDAPPLQLPEGVGFHVGGNSKIKYIVLQVHYASVDKFKDGSTDDSGVFLKYVDTPLPKTAGVLLMGTGGRIPANSVEYMETACKIEEDKVIHPFAFRTHTHALGRVVSGYKVTRDKSKKDTWTLIGKRDPQLPQMFYPVFNNVTLTKGDTVAARCTMVSNRNWATYVGGTAKDEMCNFYVMYWAYVGDGVLNQKSCFTAGAPNFYWDINGGLNNIPDDASSM